MGKAIQFAGAVSSLRCESGKISCNFSLSSATPVSTTVLMDGGLCYE